MENIKRTQTQALWSVHQSLVGLVLTGLLTITFGILSAKPALGTVALAQYKVTRGKPLVRAAWLACNTTVCDSAKECTTGFEYALIPNPSLQCGFNWWPSDCSNWNISTLCETQVFYDYCGGTAYSTVYSFKDTCG
jgi:hypothetical protein